MSRFKYEFSISEQLLRKEWLIISAIQCFLLPSLGLGISTLKGTDPALKISSLFIFCCFFLLICYCAYVRPGTKYLTFSLVAGPFMVFSNIIQQIPVVTDALDFLVLISDLSIYIWWYVLSMKLRKLDRRIKAKGLERLDVIP